MTTFDLSEDERLNWLRLSMSENVGPITFHKLLQRYGSAKAALEALPHLSQRGGMKRPLNLLPQAAAEDALSRAAKIGARFVAQCEPQYPAYLKEIASAPPLICVAGNIELAQRPAVGMVGARNASAIAMKFTRQLARDLVEAGYIVVSGLARGIDTAAHEASGANNTAAVIANGLDYFYPPENENLQRAIAERGLLVSEFTLGTVPKAEYFPRRNRVISGLSRAVIVVEAALKSGSLITARFANEQGREVFAVPGSPLDPRCEGTNKLIKDGANMLTSIDDVLQALGESRQMVDQGQLFEAEVAVPRALNELNHIEREKIYALLSPTPIDVDDLIRESGQTPEDVMAVLLELELAGKASRQSGGRISLSYNKLS